MIEESGSRRPKNIRNLIRNTGFFTPPSQICHCLYILITKFNSCFSLTSSRHDLILNTNLSALIGQVEPNFEALTKKERKSCALFWRVRAGKVCCWESIPRFPVCRKYRTNFHTWAKLSICSIFCTSNKKSNLIHTVLGTARGPIFFYKGSGEK